MGNENKKIETEEQVDISVLFNEETSDEAKEKIQAVFEAAVEARAAEITSLTEEEIADLVEERTEAVAERLMEAFDRYVSYAVEEWLAENEIAIESAMKVEMAESLLSGVVDLVAEHNLEVPEGREDVVEAVVARNEELQAKLNEAYGQIISMQEAIEDAEVESIVDEMSEGLTDTQAAKLVTLAEGIKYKDSDDFAKKLAGVKDSFFKESKRVADPVVDETGPLVEEKAEVRNVADPLVEEITKRVVSRF